MLIPFYWVLPVKFIGYHALTPPLWTYKPFVTSKCGGSGVIKKEKKAPQEDRK
jgi:hypothetical protein